MAVLHVLGLEDTAMVAEESARGHDGLLAEPCGFQEALVRLWWRVNGGWGGSWGRGGSGGGHA